MGAVRGSFPLVKEDCMLNPLPCGPENTIPIRMIIRTHIIMLPRVVFPAHILII
jgi:hypothetical protein